MDAVSLSLAFGAAFLAGAINSVAGGGTMISFPTLVALGLPPVVANATSTVGIWPGSLGSVYGFRRELARCERRILWLLAPAAVGGLLGALVLRCTPPGVFEVLVPVLLLLATVLFVLQGPLQRRLRIGEPGRPRTQRWFAAALALQFLVALYGGYFGAGMSILNLCILGVLGLQDILEMNALTSLVACAINGTAGVLFVAGGLVDGPAVLVMVVGSLAGGYGAVGVARKVGKPRIRRFVIAVGFTLAAVTAWRVLARH